MEKICGIYIITCQYKYYIGKSINVYKRLYDHKRYLSLNQHPNPHLQSAWNLYGEKAFTFEILEEYFKEYLDSFENYWCILLNTHNKKFGYNIQSIKVGNSFVNTSEETREKMRKSRKRVIITEEWKSNMRKCKPQRKAILRYDLEGNFIKDYNSIEEAAKELNCLHSTITKCVNGYRKIAMLSMWKLKNFENFPLKIEKYSGQIDGRSSRNIKI